MNFFTCFALRPNAGNLRALALGAIALASAGPALAIPTLYLNDGAGHTVTVADGSIKDSDSEVGVVTFNGALGNWTINVSTGISESPIPYVHLSSIDRSKTSGTMTIWFSDTGFHFPGGAEVAIGGVTNGTVTYSTYWDPLNRLFAGRAPTPGVLLTPTQIFKTTSYSSDKISQIYLHGTYSLTQMVQIKHTKAGVTSFDAVIGVPDAGDTTVALFGTLLGLCCWAKRRKILA